MTRCKLCGTTDATTWVEVTRYTALCGPCWRATEPTPEAPEAPKGKTRTRRAIASRSLGLDDGEWP